MLIPNPFHLLGMGGHFLLLYPIHFHLLGMGGYFLLLIPKPFSAFGYGRTFLIAIPNPFSPFGYGRVFPIAYTQTFFSFWVWAGISYCLYPIHFWFLGMGGHFLLLMPNPFSPFGYGRTFPIAYTQFIFSFWVWAAISYCLYPIHFLKMPCEGFPQGIETFFIIFLPEFSSGYPPVCLGLHSVFRLSWRNADGLNC